MRKVSRLKRGSLIVTSAALMTALAACGGGDDSGDGGGQTMKHASFMPAAGAIEMANDELFDELERDYSLEIKRYPSEALLPAAEIVPGVADGRADIGFAVPLYTPGELPLSQAGSLPFMTQSSEAWVKAWNRMITENDDLASEYEAQNLHVISFVPLAPAVIGTKEPVDSLEDLKGMKVRAIGYLGNALSAVGATPEALAAGEIYESLERGVADAFTSGSLEAGVSLSLQEVAPYFTDFGTGQFNIGILLMNKAVWDGLDAEVQDGITEKAGEFVDNAVEILEESETAACDTLKSSGGEASVLPEDQQEAFETAVGDTAVDAWKEQAIDAGVSEEAADGFLDQLESTLAETEEDSTYESGTVRCAEAS